MVQVGVTDERVLDLHLLGDRQCAPDRPRIDQDTIVHEKCGRPLPLSFAAKGPKHPDLQEVLQSDRFTIARILVYQPWPVKTTKSARALA